MAKGFDLSSNIALILSVMALLVVVEVAFVGFPKAQGQFITVTASGIAYGYPDQALLYIYANASGSTAASAAANLSATMGALNSTIATYLDNNMSLLQTQYYGDRMVQTTLCNNYTVEPIATASSQKPLYCTSLQSPGMVVQSSTCCYNVSKYAAQEYLVATVPNINSVDAALSAISAVPNVNVQSTSQQFSPSYASALMRSSLTNALSNATEQAQLLAGAGLQVEVVNISIEGSPYFYPVAFSSAQGAAASGGSTFYPGRSGIVRSVYVLFRQVPK